MASPEYVENGNHFDKYIPLQVIPVWVLWSEKTAHAVSIPVSEKIGKVFLWIILQQMIFIKSVSMKCPGIPHLGISTIINTDPAIDYGYDNFDKKEDQSLGLAESGAGKELHFGDQPGKQEQIANK